MEGLLLLSSVCSVQPCSQTGGLAPFKGCYGCAVIDSRSRLFREVFEFRGRVKLIGNREGGLTVQRHDVTQSYALLQRGSTEVSRLVG